MVSHHALLLVSGCCSHVSCKILSFLTKCYICADRELGLKAKIKILDLKCKNINEAIYTLCLIEAAACGGNVCNLLTHL